MFCHGVSSVAYLNKKFYSLTKKNEYKSNYNKFLSEILTYDDSGYGGYKRYDSPHYGYINSLSTLEGVTGVGIFLIDSCLESDDLIDKIFLLD